MNLANSIAALLSLIGVRSPSPSIAPTNNPPPRDRLRFPIRKPVVSAKGFVDPRHRAGVKRITVTLGDATFDRVKSCADAGHVSFAEAARRLIERGLPSSTPPNQGD